MFRLQGLAGVWLALATAFLVTPAALADDLVLRADPVPIIEVTINKKPVRLEVDPRLPDVLVLNPDAAARLKVKTVPFTRAAVEADGARITAKVARPDIRFANSDKDRSFALVFDRPITSHADGAIGPGSLPHDRITIYLTNPPNGAGTASTFPLKDPDVWRFETQLAPEVKAFVLFDLANPQSVLNRPTTALLERHSLIKPEGELAVTPWVLGLAPRMQPVSSDDSVAFNGRPLGPVMARTNAEVRDPDDATVVVTAKGKQEDPGIIVGRDALAGCDSITADRKTKTLSLVCER